jgi:hypothetical protein
LRSSVFFHALTTLAVLTTATHWLLSRRPHQAYLSGPALVLATCCLGTLTPLMLPILLCETRLSRRFWVALGSRSRQFLPSTRVAMAALVAISAGYKSERSRADIAAIEPLLEAWKDLGAWVQANTDPKSIFLLPVLPFGTADETPPVEGHAVYDDWGSFEASAKRQVYVDFRRGAAVMWQPSYYALWNKRVGEVLKLKSLKSKTEYSISNNIDFIVTECAEPDERSYAPVFRSEYVCLYNVKLNASGVTP